MIKQRIIVFPFGPALKKNYTKLSRKINETPSAAVRGTHDVSPLNSCPKDTREMFCCNRTEFEQMHKTQHAGLG